MSKRTKRTNAKGTHHSLTGWPRGTRPRGLLEGWWAGELGRAKKEEAQEWQEHFSRRPRGTRAP